MLDLDFPNENFPPEYEDIYRSVYSAELSELEAMRDEITQEQGVATVEEAYRAMAGSEGDALAEEQHTVCNGGNEKGNADISMSNDPTFPTTQPPWNGETLNHPTPLTCAEPAQPATSESFDVTAQTMLESNDTTTTPRDATDAGASQRNPNATEDQENENSDIQPASQPGPAGNHGVLPHRITLRLGNGVRRLARSNAARKGPSAPYYSEI